MRESFVQKKFNDEHLRLIGHADKIIGEYQAAGFTLTLRQLYYQFVARDLLPNTVQSYKRLGGIISDARLAGLLDWEAIEDRLRQVSRISSWTSPADIIESSHHSYKENLWRDQKFRPEVWIEKDALAGVIEPVCQRWRMSSLACRGYVSQSTLYEAGLRFRHLRSKGFEPVILHLGDHDPSGIDMTRDNGDRVAMFARRHSIRIERLALNRDQIDQYNPPPNPAKESDARFAGYRDIHGDESWELDALSPTVIDELIDEYVRNNLVDMEAWEASEAEEETNREKLRKASERWDEVAEFLESLE